MPLPGAFSSNANAPYTRFQGPVLSGTLFDGGVGGPKALPGGFLCVQTTASLVTQLITTTAQTALASYVYITQGSIAVSSSTNSVIAAPPPITGAGAALYFDNVRNKLSIFSTATNDWLSVTLSSS